ncbi:hypothetical protein BC834DRAFT_970298 [Gloeopeniophorella convolvens]|nr:hypothetical protein BC834DRAFT_970298 [Gloeopeniophorella convolvens]
MLEARTPRDVSRESTPGPSSPSPSFLDASTAIDDLTRTLADYSRVSTPEPPSHAHGYDCASDDSDYTKAWLAVKAKLESRLVLSAEVGQALLQRHEAYVRRMQAAEHAGSRAKATEDATDPDVDHATRQQLQDRIADLSRENAVLEKRFTQALLNNELADASNKNLNSELQETRTAYSRLSTEHARAVGWEARLRQAVQERDDFHQERNNEAQKLRVAEARLVALGDKCAKLRGQVRRLQEELEDERTKRDDMSEEVMREARERLAELQHSRVDLTSVEHHGEITKLLESLVAEREALKKSNVELQELLSESREALHTLREEAEEHRAYSPFTISKAFDTKSQYAQPKFPETPMSYGTAPGPLSPISSLFSHGRRPRGKRALSTEPPSRHSFEPLTPETSGRPLSPDSPLASGSRLLVPSRQRDEKANIELDIGSSTEDSDVEDATPSRPRGQKSLYLLQRHRGVQTDAQAWVGMLTPIQSGYGDQTSFSISPNDGQSESSSLADSGSTLGALLERVVQLFNRMAQADAKTLATRLKRQNILGADVSYLSRSTVEGIVAEVSNLRVIFRAALEDDKFTTVCTRRDLRTLLKLFKDVFRELANVRTTLNDVVLDPSIAPKVREMALNPKDEPPAVEKTPTPTSAGWMAPLSKLFGVSSSDSKRTLSPIGVGRGRPPARPTPRSVPKLEPALSASTTTVKVEFTGTGAGRAVTNLSSPVTHEPTRGSIAAPAPTRSASQNLMGIFAGAPRADAWVVVTPGPSRPAGAGADQLRRTTLGRAAGRTATAVDNADGTLSRNVDAVIDLPSAAEDRSGFDSTRTLRHRGLSDSSIRTTFMQHGDAAAAPAATTSRSPEAAGGRTVFDALTQTVRGVRSAVSGAASPEQLGSPPASATRPVHPRAVSPRFAGLMPDISSWAAASRALEAPDPDAYVGNMRQSAPPRHPWDRKESDL